MKVLIATHNPGKFDEIRGFLKGFSWEVVSLENLGIHEEFVEQADSFEENALGKARFYRELSGLPTFADDSGIFVEALKGELGVKTRRWGAGEQASDEEWLSFFLKRMEREENRRAHFICAAAYSAPDEERVCLGDTVGTLCLEAQVPLKAGIPLSSVFLPEGCAKVYAALSLEEKNALSHRGKAFKNLISLLQDA